MSAANQKELLVCGFIRNIEIILENNQIIPIEIAETPHMTYCNEYGVIYSNQGLYQMKFAENNIETLDFNFEKCKYNFNYKMEFGLASIGYIHNTHKLFIMEGSSTLGIVHTNTTQLPSSRNKECGILDLKNRQWDDVKPFEYEYKSRGRHFENDCSSSICKGNKYDINLVYIASNGGHVGKYDIIKNK
eukprot:256192_1